MPKKPRSQKLKVFCTPVGFHNAYVAAPSQKAALEAWGIEVNLFARGSAEQVTDPELMKEPLSAPGTVFKRLRGTEEEQIAALGKSPLRKLKAKGRKRRASKIEIATKTPAKRKPRPPKPSRSELAELEEVKAALDKNHRAQLSELKEREQALARERRSLERQQKREEEQIEKEIERARKHYGAAREAWENWSG